MLDPDRLRLFLLILAGLFTFSAIYLDRGNPNRG